MTAEDSAKYSRSASHAVELLQGKWKMRIIFLIRLGPVRLGQLNRQIPTASKKVLTETLRQLESTGIVVRRDLSGTVRHVEYELSEAMRAAIIVVVDQLAHLGEFSLTHGRQGIVEWSSAPPAQSKEVPVDVCANNSG
jgi:DNA-binding HxlR family transcriptional regulator